MIDPKKIKYSKLPHFRFRKINDDYIVTNDIGEFVLLNETCFEDYIYGEIKKDSPSYDELASKSFFKEKVDEVVMAERFKKKNSFLFQSGPSLHIIVLTSHCDHGCLYCQASSTRSEKNCFHMNDEIAKKTVDFIFKSKNKFLAIEFQGGEPLFNFPQIKNIIKLVNEKNKTEKRDIELRLVSNFTQMDNEKMTYLFENNVVFCTSMDGPEKLHNKNRIWTEGNSYKTTVNWLKKLLNKYQDYYIYQPSALTTITKHSLPLYREIIKEYIDLGFDNIFLRPLTPLGMAVKTWEKIGYTPQEFLDFYKKSLDYILDLNKKSDIPFREMTATYMLTKILTEKDPNYFELRSVCGAGIGQMLYNYDGDIYTCDEGRMTGDDMFKLGNVTDDYKDVIDCPTVKTMCMASCLDNLPCDHCAYKPYCGTCPIVNHAETGNIFPQLSNSTRCVINKGIFDYLFEKIKDEKNKKIFTNWVSTRNQYKK